MVEVTELHAGSDDGFETEDENLSETLSVDASSDIDDTELVLFDPSKESLSDRFYALKDIVSPSTRHSIYNLTSRSYGYARWAGSTIGLVGWWITTSAILVGLPLALAVEGESQERFLEKEQAQGQQMMLPGQQTQSSGVVPPGF